MNSRPVSFKISILLICLLTALESFAQVKGCHTTIYLKYTKPAATGKIKHITEANYYFTGTVKNPAKKINSIKLYNYDETGHIIKFSLVVYPAENISDTEISVYSYDQKGRLVIKAQHSISFKDELIEERYSYLNDDTLVAEVNQTLNGIPISKSVYTYNAEGRRSVAVDSNSIETAGNVKHSYRYDSSGNEIESKTTNHTGKLTNKTTRKYDTKGNIIETRIYNSIDTLIWRSVSSYDSNNNETDNTQFDRGEIKTNIHYTYSKYDTHGNYLRRNLYVKKEQKGS
ncbi:MAG: hypothetical protein H7257_03825 [Taibaiella sp.]|nr:hypothetical protein [Taibaiella sp.]